MDNNTILMIVVAIVLGMLVANMLKDVCGCKNLIEGQGTEGWEQICGSGPPDDSSQECVLSTPAASECMNADPVVGCNCYEYSGPQRFLKSRWSRAGVAEGPLPILLCVVRSGPGSVPPPPPPPRPRRRPRPRRPRPRRPRPRRPRAAPAPPASVSGSGT